ncbi:MAG: hypothetical protein WCK91_02160 [bacterium]
MKRVIFDIVLFVCLFIAPWWITAVIAIAGIFVFTQFYEYIIAGIMMFALFHTPGGSNLIASPFWFCTIIASIYVLAQLARRYIILYKV